MGRAVLEPPGRRAMGNIDPCADEPGLRFAAAVAFQRAGTGADGAGAADPPASVPGLKMGAAPFRAAEVRCSEPPPPTLEAPPAIDPSLLKKGAAPRRAAMV